MAVEPYTIFFTGKDDPRDNLIVIGTTSRPIFFRFETPDAFASLATRTTASFWFPHRVRGYGD
jgi:hypothetical protein